MEYRRMSIDEAERIKEIDAEHFIHNAWREVDGERKLVVIDWTDYELPNGLEWHLEHFRETVKNGGAAFGCFDGEKLVGYCCVDAEMFGSKAQYVLFDQLFVSKDYRKKGIGRQLLMMAAEEAAKNGADRLYICAGSAENTIAFYMRLGCRNAEEINQELYELDERDFQLEYLIS